MKAIPSSSEVIAGAFCRWLIFITLNLFSKPLLIDKEPKHSPQLK